MEDTKKLLVDAANFAYPLSIILVGLTSKDKEKRRNMNLLDGDTKALSYRNQKAKRDIVQFVGKAHTLKIRRGFLLTNHMI